jgi:hypothetical protein
MGRLLLVGTFVAHCTVTSYRSVASQTDATPFYTSIREHVKPGGVAISRDLLCGACRKLHHRCKEPSYAPKLHYGDMVFVKGIGVFTINDVMGDTKYDKRTHKRNLIRRSIDIWVTTYQEEKEVGVRFNDVYVLRLEENENGNMPSNSVWKGLWKTGLLYFQEGLCSGGITVP